MQIISREGLNSRSRKLHPQYIVGFVDGEGSFHIAIYKDTRMKTKIKFIPEFHVSQRLSSRIVLEELNEFFRCGYIKQNHAKNPRDKTLVFIVRNRQDLLEKIIPFFEQHRLRTEKNKDFILFAKVLHAMERKEHRTLSGVRKILAWTYQMNQAGRYRKKKYTI